MLEELKKYGLSEEDAQKVVDHQEDLEKIIVKDKYIPLTKFNEINEDNKEKDKTIKKLDKDIEDIKAKAGDNEELTKTITQLQADNKKAKEDYESQISTTKKETAVKLLIANQVHDVDDVVSKIDLSKIELDGDTTKIKAGFNDQFANLKKEKAYLFKEEKPADDGKRKSFVKGIAQPKDGSDNNAGDGDKKPVNPGVEMAKALASRNNAGTKSDDYYFGGKNKEE